MNTMMLPSKRKLEQAIREYEFGLPFNKEVSEVKVSIDRDYHSDISEEAKEGGVIHTINAKVTLYWYLQQRSETYNDCDYPLDKLLGIIKNGL